MRMDEWWKEDTVRNYMRSEVSDLHVIVLLINFNSPITPAEVSVRGGMGLVRSLWLKSPALGEALKKGGHGTREVSCKAASGGPIAPFIKKEWCD